MKKNSTQLLVAGAGYLGLRAAKAFVDAGDSVAAITRSATKAEQFRQHGLSPIIADLTVAGALAEVPAARFVLWSVGFDASGTNREAIWIDGLRNLIQSLPEAPEAFVYVSSTSVYANGDGSDVSEDSEVGPISEGGKCCLLAETLMNEEISRTFPDTKRIVLRQAGIYGPNRLLRRVEDLRASKPLPGDGDTWLNLIHVDDAVRLIRHILYLPSPPNLINVVNTGTVTRRQYYTRLAELTGTPKPQFGGNASRRARGGNKRVISKHLSLAAGYQFDDVLGGGLPDAVRRSDNL